MRGTFQEHFAKWNGITAENAFHKHERNLLEEDLLKKHSIRGGIQ
jgi:hypothetical protein